MKLFKLLPVFALLLFSSCDEAKKETDDMDDMAEQADLRDPAEANKQWIDAWNRNNPRSWTRLRLKMQFFICRVKDECRQYSFLV